MTEQGRPQVSLGDVLDDSDPSPKPSRPRRRARGGPRPARLEPVFWLSFSAGGMVAAFLFPIHLIIIGIAFAAGWLPKDALSYDRMHDLLGNLLVKLYVLGLVSLPLYHWAHRFRYVVHHQFGLHAGKRLVATLFYGAAILGTVLTAAVLLRI